MEYTYSNQDNTKKNNNCSRLSNISYPSRTVVHAKLEMTEPGDHDEQEADAVANTIAAGGKISRKFSGGSGSSGITVSNQMESQLNHLQGGGQAMPTGLRSMMESGFGQDFSHVRLHTDSEAASMSSSIHAKAFTHGNDIYFNQGQFSPNTTEGQKLMAHELTHVVQGGGKIGRDISNDSSNSDNEYMDFYENVKDADWILTEENKKKIKENYKTPDKRQPITVILFTTKEAGGDAFENDKGTNAFVSQEIMTKVLIVQGKNSLDEYALAIEKLSQKHGPLQNVIIQGHGNHNLASLGKDNNGKSIIIDNSEKSDSFFTKIKELFDEADRETSGQLNHSFLFPVCLTGANKHSPNGLINHVKCLMPGVHVRGNLASVKQGQVYDHMDTENQVCSPDAPLSFIDTEDPSSPVTAVNQTSANEGQRDRYTGPDVYGFLHDVKNYLEFPESSQMSPNLDSNRKIDNYEIKNNRGIIREIRGKSILRIVRENISSNPDATLSFVNYLLFNPSAFKNIVTNIDPENPLYEDYSVYCMFIHANVFSYEKDIIYSK